MQLSSSQRLIRRRFLCVRSAGFTLVELLIVCGMLAAIAAISWPAVRNSLAKSRLKKAASDVRTTIGRTRNDAIRRGQSFTLRYELDGRRYRIDLFSQQHPEEVNTIDDMADRLSDGASLGTEASTDEVSDFEPIERELPEGVRFTSVDDESDHDPLASFASMETPVPSEEFFESEMPETTEWSEPIVFQANGRTDNAQVRLINQRNFYIDLSLRGLTGIVSSTPPARNVMIEGSDTLLSEGTNMPPLTSEASEP